jgi:hypothetical protein
MAKRSARVLLLAIATCLLLVGAAQAQGLVVTAAVNLPLFTAVGQVLSGSVGINNPGIGGLADIYVGLLTPEGTIAFVTSGGFGVGTVADLTTFQPLVEDVPLDIPFAVDVPDFFVHQWTIDDQRGEFTFFMLVLSAGALADGALTLDEILAVSLAPFVYAPRPIVS